MSAIESAFVNSIIIQERDKTKDSRVRNLYQNTHIQCVQQDTMAKRISGLRMWTSRNVDEDKSGYVLARISTNSRLKLSLIVSRSPRRT